MVSGDARQMVPTDNPADETHVASAEDDDVLLSSLVPRMMVIRQQYDF
jgi:hypothetical protein